MARDVAGAVEKIRQKVEADIGEPVTAVLPNLSSSGATAGVAFSQVSGVLGMAQNRTANKRGGGAASITFAKNRLGLLALTGAGRLKLFRTKVKSRGPQLEDLVGEWGPGEVQVSIVRARKLITITLARPGEPDLAFEIIDVMGAIAMVEPFARAVNVEIA